MSISWQTMTFLPLPPLWERKLLQSFKIKVGTYKYRHFYSSFWHSTLNVMIVVIHQWNFTYIKVLQWPNLWTSSPRWMLMKDMAPRTCWSLSRVERTLRSGRRKWNLQIHYCSDQDIWWFHCPNFILKTVEMLLWKITLFHRMRNQVCKIVYFKMYVLYFLFMYWTFIYDCCRMEGVRTKC